MKNKYLKILIIAYGLLTTAFIGAQVNLVPNQSFETYTACPTGAAQINYSNNWDTPTVGTPDYFNTCANIPTGVNVPTNFMGYQTANNGNAYSGLFAYYDFFQTYREYVQGQLTSTLVANKKYYIAIYVSLSDSSRYATDDFGIYITPNAISRTDWDAFGFSPQIQNPSGQFLSNKNGWTKISGSFIASGNELFITIGNFKSDANTDTLRLMSNSTTNSDFNASYYYVDAVCLSDDSLTCNNLVGIKSIENITTNIYYNSYTKKIIVKENGDYTIKVFDIYGNVNNEMKLNGHNDIDVSFYESGSYIVLFNNSKGSSIKKLIINN